MATHVPEEWIEEVEAFRSERGWTLVDLGREAARAIGRSKAFPPSTMSRYMTGQRSPIEVTQALAVLMGREIPSVAQIEDEVLSEWLRLGAELQRLAPVYFGRVVEHVRQTVTVLRNEPTRP